VHTKHDNFENTKISINNSTLGYTFANAILIEDKTLIKCNKKRKHIKLERHKWKKYLVCIMLTVVLFENERSPSAT